MCRRRHASLLLVTAVYAGSSLGGRLPGSKAGLAAAGMMPGTRDKAAPRFSKVEPDGRPPAGISSVRRMRNDRKAPRQACRPKSQLVRRRDPPSIRSWRRLVSRASTSRNNGSSPEDLSARHQGRRSNCAAIQSAGVNRHSNFACRTGFWRARLRASPRPLQLERPVRSPDRHGYSVPCEHCRHGALHGFIGCGGRNSPFSDHPLKLGGIAIGVPHGPQCGFCHLALPPHQAVQQAIEGVFEIRRMHSHANVHWTGLVCPMR